jgi:uncharacterized damage-inducible protein DinB
MAIRDLLLPEFDQEMANTRKMLERLPDGRLDFQPHPKSWKADHLAGHVSELPGWIPYMTDGERLDVVTGQFKPFEPKTRQEVLDNFDKNVREGREALSKVTDEQMQTIWTMTWDGKEIMSAPRYTILRGVVFNHLVHHRAQLGVYLRLMDVAVPGMYGPSADDMAMIGSGTEVAA